MNEIRINQIENILDQIINVSANQETTKIIPNAEVINAAPAWLSASYIIVQDDTGHYIPALKIPGIIYTTGDNVNLLMMKGTEPVAFQHGSSSSGENGGGWPFDNIRSVDLNNVFADDANLPDAVTNATAGDVVILNPGTYTLAAILDIDKSLTIDGIDSDKVTIQYSGADDTIHINAANVTLQNLTILNTTTTAQKGCVMVDNTGYVIRNCVLSHTGVSAENRTLRVLGSTGKVIECDISSSGGSKNLGIYNDSGNAVVDIIRSTVGGADSDLSPRAAGTIFTLTDSVLTNGKVQTTSGGTVTGTLDGTILVNNGSGATAVKGDVGYLDEAGDYQRTTTEADNVAWCIVEIGDFNGENIFVRRRGETTVNYDTGDDTPSIGDFLVTSTSAGDATTSTVPDGAGGTLRGLMRPEIFAVCTANGAGGTVVVQLLTGTTDFSVTNANNILLVQNSSDTDFISTINGAPTATTVVYGAVTSGTEDAIVPNSVNELGKMVLHCTAGAGAGTSRLITAVNTGTNTITTVSSTDSWGDTDTIEIRSVTTPIVAAYRFIDIDCSQSPTVILPLTRALRIEMLYSDSGGANLLYQTHPYEAFSGPKAKNAILQVAGTLANSYVTIPLTNSIFTHRAQASGAGTMSRWIIIQGIKVASP